VAVDQATKPNRDQEPTPVGPTPSGEPGVAWIHSLAGEWQSRWERVQNPQALSGASLLK
jgi:hypothetical protein